MIRLGTVLLTELMWYRRNYSHKYITTNKLVQKMRLLSYFLYYISSQYIAFTNWKIFYRNIHFTLFYILYM